MQSLGPKQDIIYVAVVDDDERVCRSFGRLLRKSLSRLLRPLSVAEQSSSFAGSPRGLEFLVF